MYLWMFGKDTLYIPEDIRAPVWSIVVIYGPGLCDHMEYLS